ncbi:MAG: SPOR domain-containing protein [Rickettsiales bacterium]|nr:SPOR domain-containing protein [Rickettsiales bacterium]
MVTPLSQAHAQTVFMVQLGSFKSPEEAKGQWEKLTKTFPDLFQPLTYAPTEVMLPPDDFVYHRTQAGPIATRNDADRICERVVSGGFECYVVETAMFTAPYNEADAKQVGQSVAAPVAEAQSTFFDSAAEDAQPEPVAQPQRMLEKQLAAKANEPQAPIATMAAPVTKPAAPATRLPQLDAVPVASAPVKVPVPAASSAVAPALTATSANTAPAFVPANSPFISGPSVPEGGVGAVQTSSPVVAPAFTSAASPNVAGGRANVSVAEAIPVPLSNLNNTANQAGGSIFRGSPSSYNRRMSIWAEIGYFDTQGAALGYWNVLRQRDASLPGGLRLRVTQPFTQKHLAKKLSLRVGPFEKVVSVRRLCSFTRPEKLGCRAVRDLGGSISVQSGAGGAAPVKGVGRYSGRTQTVSGAASAPFAASGNRAAEANGFFWIQLGAFLAPQAAMDKWSDLQLLHKTELGSLNNQIYTPKGTRGLFRLRAGPFARAGDAVSTCEALKRKGTLCVVVSER